MNSKLVLIIAIALTLIVGGLEIASYNVTGEFGSAWLSVLLIALVWVIYILNVKGIMFADKKPKK